MVAVALLVLALAVRARATDVFSPGELSRAHAPLEGLAGCTKCHVAGKQLAGERCLACHTELAGRVARGIGLHGRLPARDRAECQTCHPEHQGRDFSLVDWGKAGMAGFDHARTGVELRGRHRGVACARCHDRRLLADPAIVRMLEVQPGRATFLGAPSACARCHFDEHRGQLGEDCARCHGEEGWRPARGFDHARTAYPLAGRHATVACARCHPRVEETARAAAPGQTAPRSATAFLRYRPIAAQRCLDCHKDPHAGRLGEACAGCHASFDDWQRVTGLGAERAFHERTRYPLRGAHVTASCEACHGPWPGTKARFRGIAFARCTDCHLDAHLGQLPAGRGAAEGDARTCDRCHGVDRFLPARFEAADHDRARYRLEGAHRAVACASCHARDARLEAKVDGSARAELLRRRRPVRLSLGRYEIARADDCRTCHRDPHGGQFAERLARDGCRGCHDVASWKAPGFDHARDARFELAGRHAPAACGACHRPGPDGAVRWRGVARTCAGCHADPHVGQLAVEGETDCARCHEARGWRETRFRHEPPFTTWRLDGKHRTVACARCHAEVAVVGGAPVRRYRPLPLACEGCHADFHRGAFRGFRP